MFSNIIIARYKAHKKHGDKSLEHGNRLFMSSHDTNGIYGPFVPDWDNKQNRILVEEIGEISKAMNEYALGNINYKEYNDNLANEIIDSMAVLSAWLDKINNITLKMRVEEVEIEFSENIEDMI